MSNSVAR